MENFLLKKRKIILQIILIISVIVIIRNYQQQGLIKDTIPNFITTNIIGEKINLNNIDKPILIHFWATWCKICSFGIDNIENIAKDYQVLNIAVDSSKNTAVKEYAKENKMNLKNIINDNTDTLTRLFGVKVVPTSFIIDSNKEIKFKEVGHTTELGLRLRLMWSK